MDTSVLSGWIHEELVHDRPIGPILGPLLLEEDGLHRITLDTVADVPFSFFKCALQGVCDKHVNPVFTIDSLRSTSAWVC